MKLLYKKNKGNKKEHDFFEFDIGVFRPKAINWFVEGEKKKTKTLLTRIYFQTITAGKAKIIYAKTRNDELMHISYVIPPCFKFPFLEKKDFEIGPCVTFPRFRGQGVYPSVLQYIIENIGEKESLFYMIVDDKNVASIKGIEKAGFEKIGVVKKTRALKRYCVLEEMGKWENQ